MIKSDREFRARLDERFLTVSSLLDNIADDISILLSREEKGKIVDLSNQIFELRNEITGIDDEDYDKIGV